MTSKAAEAKGAGTKQRMDTGSLMEQILSNGSGMLWAGLALPWYSEAQKNNYAVMIVPLLPLMASDTVSSEAIRTLPAGFFSR